MRNDVLLLFYVTQALAAIRSQLELREALGPRNRLGVHSCAKLSFGDALSGASKSLPRRRPHGMFTGIIEEIGLVDSLDQQAAGARLAIAAKTVVSDLPVGGSIAVNGVCLTAVEVTTSSFAADLSPETLNRTNLGALKRGSNVNLERPLGPGGRLSGHFVQGHVDGAGEFLSLEALGDGNWWLSIRAPRELLRYLVFKGSIAIDGISLTIAALKDDVVSVAIIPHTYRETSLGALRPGSRVNLECDMIAKHVERLLQTIDLEGKSRLSVQELEEQGY